MNEQWQRWDTSGGIIRTNRGSNGIPVVASYEQTVAAMGCQWRHHTNEQWQRWDTSGGIIRTNSGSDGTPVLASYERTVAAMGYQWWYHTNEQWQPWDASGGIIRTNSGSDGMDTSGGIIRTNSGSDGMPVVAPYERTAFAKHYQRCLKIQQKLKWCLREQVCRRQSINTSYCTCVQLVLFACHFRQHYGMILFN